MPATVPPPPPPALSAPPVPPPATPLPAIEIDDGVIEEARRRQRRRRRTGISVSLLAAAIAIGVMVSNGGGRSHSGAAGEPSPARPLKLTLLHGRAFVGGQPALMGVTPSLQAGNVGVCVRVVGGEGCNGPYPTAAYPVYGGEGGFEPKEKVGPAGEIDAVFTGPGVAAVRVAHLGTFKAQSAPGLPPGAKQVVFYRPPGSRGSVLPPGTSPSALEGFEHARRGPALTETLLDRSGHAILVGKSPTFTLPNSYWQGTQPPPARGRCALSSSLPGARMAWGQVATEVAPDRSILTPGWFTCLNTWFSFDGASYEAAILLNAKSPGKPPAMLWGAVPLAGHPGMVEIPAVQRAVHIRVSSRRRRQTPREQTFWDVLVPQTVARRVGPAWLLLSYGRDLNEQIRFLQTLHVTKMELSRK